MENAAWRVTDYSCMLVGKANIIMPKRSSRMYVRV